MQTSFHIQIRISITSLAMFLVKTWRTLAFGLYGYKNFMKSGFVEHSKNFRPEDMQVQLEGKNCIVTGANSGIGYATAEGLASRGATVYMVCRNKERGEAALSEIQSITGSKSVHLEICDISSISDVKSFAARFSSKDVPVHVLVNNAGLLENDRRTTSEGYEMNFAVNVLGTYTMTELMLPLLEKAAPDARVITVSSGGMYSVPLMEDLQFSGNKFDGVEQYSRNKRVQVALTEKWADMYKDKDIGFYSMHPGWAETPGVDKSLPNFSKSSGFQRERRGPSAVMGKDVEVWLQSFPPHHIDATVQSDDCPDRWRFTGFYGFLKVARRKEGWDLLRKLSRVSVQSWLCAGDFNEVLEQHEKQGSHPRAHWQIRDFHECLQDCVLQDLGFQGYRNTSYFHAKVNERRLHKEIKCIKDESGLEVVSRDGIQRVILQYFGSMFKSTHPMTETIEDVLGCLEGRVTSAMKDELTKPFTSEEVEQALQQMHPLKFPGPDEVFSGLIRQAESEGAIQGVAISRSAPPISHLLFADDTFIFCQATQEALSRLQLILHSFEAASGLKINKQKSAMVFSRNVADSVRLELAGILGVAVVAKHDKYLGLPTVIGHSKKEMFDGIKERIRQKLHSLSTKKLSQAG
ncbi:UNVERIFIED_CONTAM: Dehydrogenase/reductase SDR family member 12 [Sesamum latifolium]|uniref:Dehydrogenase/reductase SDR family member 12 n=1 Tax=Sesamum latifolium TaxID=2727402 RepID=A0AAW2WFV2_9LAMI